MTINDDTWKAVQKRLKYTDEEMRTFKENPRNEKVLRKTTDIMNKTIVVEVVEAHGCNSEHKVGDKFYFDGAGNLLSKYNPNKICIYALSPIAPLIFTSNELLYADVDPNKMLFKRTGCFDVGVKCGGWGQVVMEISVKEREKIKT